MDTSTLLLLGVGAYLFLRGRAATPATGTIASSGTTAATSAAATAATAAATHAAVATAAQLAPTGGQNVFVSPQTPGYLTTTYDPTRAQPYQNVRTAVGPTTHWVQDPTNPAADGGGWVFVIDVVPPAPAGWVWQPVLFTPTPATADGRGPWPSSPAGQIYLTRPGVTLPMVSTGAGA